MQIGTICTNVNQDTEGNLYVLCDNAFSSLLGKWGDAGQMGADRHVFVLPAL